MVLLFSFVTKQKWFYKKKKICLFHSFILFSTVLLLALNKLFGLFHPVSEFSYISYLFHLL